MSFYAVPTVRIAAPVTEANPSGFIVINQADFDSDRHETYADPAAAETVSKSARKAKG